MPGCKHTLAASKYQAQKCGFACFTNFQARDASRASESGPHAGWLTPVKFSLSCLSRNCFIFRCHAASPPFRPVATDIRPRTQRQRITSLDGVARTNHLRVRVDNPSGEYPREAESHQSLRPVGGPQQRRHPVNRTWAPATTLSPGGRGLSPVQASECLGQGLRVSAWFLQSRPGYSVILLVHATLMDVI